MMYARIYFDIYMGESCPGDRWALFALICIWLICASQIKQVALAYSDAIERNYSSYIHIDDKNNCSDKTI